MFRNFSLISKFKYFCQYRYISKVKLVNIPKNDAGMSIAVIDACSYVGKIASLLLKREKVFDTLILYDDDDLCGHMADLRCINTTTKIRSYSGKMNLGAALSEARIVLICSGNKKKSKHTNKDLFRENANRVRQIIIYLTEYNPRAMVIIGTPPVSCLVPMAVEEYRKNDIAAGNQVFGLANIFLSRAGSIAAQFHNSAKIPTDLYVIGGCDNDTILPILSQYPRAAALSEKQQEELILRIKDAEDEVLYIKEDESNKTGCYLSLAYNSCKFAKKLARALLGERNVKDFAYVKQKPPMDSIYSYFTSIVTLNKYGLEKCEIPELSNTEKYRLQRVNKRLKEYIHVGQNYVNGDELFQTPRLLPPPVKIDKKPPEVKPPKPKEEELCKKRPPLKQIILRKN